LNHLNLVAQQEFFLCLELGPVVANRAVRDDPQVNGFVASQTVLGRVGGADDIGALVAGLLSSTGDWANGQRIEASGGIFI
jgi:NAD(P)-dependent dehydrogenase (short-subunit alcohol dehydrogenase family)